MIFFTVFSHVFKIKSLRVRVLILRNIDLWRCIIFGGGGKVCCTVGCYLIDTKAIVFRGTDRSSNTAEYCQGGTKFVNKAPHENQ